jgi:hypothetical protein
MSLYRRSLASQTAILFTPEAITPSMLDAGRWYARAVAGGVLDVALA